uniref:hypothetical protein n=1 Tax=Streptomyces galilaeus TaxID=33899 RepID=UPI0038F5DE13
IFSLQGKKHKYAAYKQFLEFENSEEISAFYNAKKLLSVLGCEDFIENIKDHIASPNSESKLVVKKYSAEDVISYLAQYFG